MKDKKTMYQKDKEIKKYTRIKTLNNGSKNIFNLNWALKVFFLTLATSTMFSAISELILTKSNIIVSFFIIIILLVLGTVFDMVGVASTSANESYFLSQDNKNGRGVKESLTLIKNASKVSNFCCDIIGDICGILGGAAGATIVIKIVSIQGVDFARILISSLISGSIAAITVFLKSLGKDYAVQFSNKIVFATGKLLSLLTTK